MSVTIDTRGVDIGSHQYTNTDHSTSTTCSTVPDRSSNSYSPGIGEPSGLAADLSRSQSMAPCVLFRSIVMPSLEDALSWHLVSRSSLCKRITGGPPTGRRKMLARRSGCPFIKRMFRHRSIIAIASGVQASVVRVLCQIFSTSGRPVPTAHPVEDSNYIQIATSVG